MTTLYKQVGSNVVEMTAEEVALNDTAQTEANTYFNREKRNQLLADSDWTQFNDSPLTGDVKTSWATYRQTLRDITSTDAWPNVSFPDTP
jgi:hypothetical protein